MLALSAACFIAHAACLPTTLADVDSINFALGVRDFDVSRHQPHPPGYPVFIALAKASTAVVRLAGVQSPEVRGLSLLSALTGAMLIPLLFQLYIALLTDRLAALWAAVLTGLSPLLWFNALRPLSDMTGLTAALAAQVLLVMVLSGRESRTRLRWLTIGALSCGVAIGVRSQNFLLTLPMLGLVVLAPGSGLHTKHRIAAVAMAILGGLLWAVPMLIVSGGVGAYLESLRAQAGEDFSGVVMLWTARTPRVAAEAIAYTFLWPWGNLVAGGLAVVLAAVGAVRMGLRAPRALGVLCIAFVPYAIFHLLFHETVTTRYALPLVVPTALLMVFALAGMGRRMLHAGGAALTIWSLVVTVPAAREYASTPSPAVRAIQEAPAATAQGSVVAMHAVFLRPQQWYQGSTAGRVIRRSHGQEISGLVDLWRGEPDAHVVFLADPRRSDLAMLDARTRSMTGSYEWGFPEFPLLGGVRPNGAQVFGLRPPGWMLGEGWAVTAEVGGQTARLGAGPSRRPATVWVRSRADQATLMIGGRDIGQASARISIRAGDTVIHSFEAQPGFFFETLDLPAGSLDAGSKYVPLEVAAAPTNGVPTRVTLEQFDLQSDGVPMLGALSGWQEPEFNPGTGRTWRWMSERATLWIRPAGRDVRLRIVAESPLRYFKAAPNLHATVGGQTIGRLSPSDDFTWELTIPPGLLVSAGYEVVIESDSSFVPGNGDQRNLALRVFALSVN